MLVVSFVPRPRASKPSMLMLMLGLVLASASLGGCAKSCKNDHPYVPYAVGDEAGHDTDPASSPAPPPSGASGGEGVLKAPPASTTWRVEGLELVAPEGREFVLALAYDVDGDGKKDVLALARPPAKTAPPVTAGDILFYRASGGAKPAFAPIASAPDVRVDAACTPVARLERVGPRSAFVELGAACTTGTTSRSLFVVRLGASPSLAFDAVLTDPYAAPKLTVDVDGTDRDKDGIDDIALKFTIEGGGPPFEPGPRMTAKVAFFDRPAGLSRDPDEPEASLRAAAGQLAARATKPKEAASVPQAVQQLRALYRAMCVEAGAPRIGKLRGGASLTCGNSKPLEDAGLAEVRAFVTQGDAIRAFAAADVAQRAPATRTPARTAELEAMLREVAPAATASNVRTLAVMVDGVTGSHPSWAPIAFEPSGKLLVRHGSRVVRVDPETGEDAEAEGLPAWSSQVVSPDGKLRWLEAYHACEGVALRATFAPTGDGDMKDVLLPVAPGLGARCAGVRGEAATVQPIAWGARGVEAVVAGVPLLVKPEVSKAGVLAAFTDEVPPLGSPRSPNGRSLAVVTTRGVIVKSDVTRLVRASAFEPWANLRHCTVDDGVLRLACIVHGKVVVASIGK